MNDTDDGRFTYRAADMLTGSHAPKIKGREPYWRPVAPPICDQVRLPRWAWERHDLAGHHPDDLISMDVNAAFLAACSSAQFAHGALSADHWDGTLNKPGLYLVDVHPWQEAEIVSPLGDQPLTDDRAWVARPTAVLLDWLSLNGYWPQVTVHQAYTSKEACRLSRWTTKIRDDRAAVLARRLAGDPAAEADYQAIKDGYSIAVEMMKGPAEGQPAKGSMRRPDWYLTVHAQHASSTWRKAWNTILAGHGPVAMGHVDEITWTMDDLRELQMRSEPVVRIDPTGVQIGALQVKSEE